MFDADTVFPLKTVHKLKGTHIEIIDPFQKVIRKRESRLWYIYTICLFNVKRNHKAWKSKFYLRIEGIGKQIFIHTTQLRFEGTCHV